LKNTIGEDEAIVATFFSATSATAPVGGVIVGGIVMQHYGGYTHRTSQKILVLMGYCAIACAFPIPFLDNFYVIAALFWGLLFFGGFILPPATGIMISSVGIFQRSQANSIANLFYNLFGYLPAPVLYGTISKAAERFDEKNLLSRSAMFFLMFMVFPAVMCL
jgi:MFS family permease